jgi:acetyl-CoA synthetase
VTSFPPWTWTIPEYFNIAVACTDVHANSPLAERAAVIVDDDAHGVRQATFAELAAQTSRFGELLRTQGITPGDRVLIRLPNCLEYPIVFLGAMKCGAIPVPTSILLTTEELLYLARDSGARVLVTDAASWAMTRDTLATLDHLTHVVRVGPAAPPGPRSTRCTELDLDSALAAIASWHAPHLTRADDPAYLVYTSGTTGYPKGVLHAHRALIGRQPSSTYWFNFRAEGDRVLHSGKFNWTYVLGTGLMDPLYRGHTAIVHEGSHDADRWVPLIATHGATTFIGVPTLYRHIVQHTTYGREDVPTLRHCMSAGEHLSEDLLARWRERFGLDIYEGLGMTECSYYLCETASRPIRPGSAGFVQPGHDVKLLDPETLCEVPRGSEGMLCIPRSDPALLLRYWNQPEETARCFRGDWFLTGDYARQDDDGYLWFLGRKDDLIKSFGYRVSPHEVERVLKEHPDIADAAVTGEQVSADKLLVVAYVIPRADSALGPDAVVAYARAHLASYKVPKVVYLVDDFPRTPNGKLQRRALTPASARARSA